jgi:hypothetical protein
MQNHRSSSLRLSAIAAILEITCTVLPAHAGLVVDPANDFIPTYTGPQIGALDVVSANVSLVGGNRFDFTGTMNGNISAAPLGAAYVFGINTGLNIAPFSFPPLPLTGTGDNVLFDFVVVLIPNGLIPGVDGLFGSIFAPLSPILAGGVSVSGATISTSLDTSLIPSHGGFTFEQYTWNLWPRSGLNASDNREISDFAPNNTNASVVSEPETLGLFVSSLLGVALLRRRRTSQ